MLLVGLVAGTVGVALFGGRVDLESLDRDVSVGRPSVADVPGEMGFRVLEPLRGDDDTMSVAVGLAGAPVSTTCAISAESGDEVTSRRARSEDAFVDTFTEEDYFPIIVAEDLDPGDYVARCSAGGEPSQTDGTFTVGRVLTFGEMWDTVGPLLGALGALVVAGIVGFAGAVLLVIGLVVGTRSKRPPTWPPPGPGGAGPGRGSAPTAP